MCTFKKAKANPKKGDIIRMKANDGCLIGNYFIVCDAKDKYVCFANMIKDGVVQTDSMYMFQKTNIGIVPTVKFKTSKDIINDVKVGKISYLKLDYTQQVEEGLLKFENARRKDPIYVAVLYGNKLEDRCYVQFTSMLKTMKVIRTLCDNYGEPHLTIYNIIPC